MAATHFYTANATEWQTALLKDGFINEGVACYVYLQTDGGLAPLFRLLHQATGAHFYTMNAAERDNATSNLGYSYEGIACYIYPQQVPGTVPLYRAFQGSSDDHFYTTTLAEQQNAVANLGYSNEGVTGWVLAGPAGGAVPLHRMYGPETQTFYHNLGSMAGWVRVEITSAGTITYSGHVHNDAAIAEAFDFRIRAVVGNGQAVLVQFSGHVAGTGGLPRSGTATGRRPRPAPTSPLTTSHSPPQTHSTSMRTGRGRSLASCRRSAPSSAPGWNKWSWIRP